MNPADLYLRLREKEGRIYSDDVVVSLPDVSVDHPLVNEWRARADSSARLTRYLMGCSRPLDILELGCGNGWLSHKLSRISDARVWGLDRGNRELTQATRLFSGSNLIFLVADIFRAPFVRRSFDVIVLASVIQYFPDLHALIITLRSLLKLSGEIHLLDSPLYEEYELPAARERTRAYYASLGLSEMTEHYFHHLASALDGFLPRWLYRPDGLRARLAQQLGKVVSPFPWISLR